MASERCAPTAAMLRAGREAVLRAVPPPRAAPALGATHTCFLPPQHPLPAHGTLSARLLWGRV